MRGQCLCDGVAFEVDCEQLKLYQCRCSLCRRQGGSSSNSAAIVPSSRFRWLHGDELISSWVRASGFRSDFCSRCGSPLPNPLGGTSYHWIPAGLLDDTDGLTVVAQVCWASRAGWDSDVAPGVLHHGVPEDFEAFIEFLQ
jgi:hypothetical protein